ncbi:MAG: hypothetical protein V1686_00530 [Patescibacteria group bacterium]
MTDINLIPKEYKRKGMALGTIFSKTGSIILILLILSLLTYGGFFFYKKQIQKNLDGINQEIKNLESKRSSDLEKSIYGADKKMNLVENIFKGHVYWSKFLTKIEELVVPQVYFSESKFGIVGNQVDVILSGSAKTYTGLARQMVAFSEDPSVEKIELTETTLNEDSGIDFGFSILFSKNILINELDKK